MYTKTFAVTVVASLLASVNAHLAIQQPPPIPGSDSKSPLDPSGSNFPCQGASLTSGTVTNMAAGSVQPLQFNLGGGANTAVHGGGSCQVSITYDTDPAKVKNPANWKVLHSWIGGCPTDAKGNLGTSVPCTGSGTECVNQGFTFNVPQEVKAGSAILAWTWFNNIGNREMYMNCARVSISGGNGNVDSLPSLFAANIGNGCATSEGFNTDFPTPGQYVTKDSSLNYPLKAGVGSCGSGAGSAGTPSTPASGSTGSASGSASSASAASGSASSASAASGSASSGSSSGASTGSSGSAASAASAAAAPVSSAKASGRKGKGTGTFAEGAAAAAPAVSAPEVASAGATSGASGAVPCTASGFYCISATTFGLCDNGYAVPMAVAAGTTCSGGSISAVRRRHISIRHAHHRRSFFGASQ